MQGLKHDSLKFREMYFENAKLHERKSCQNTSIKQIYPFKMQNTDVFTHTFSTCEKSSTLLKLFVKWK